MKLNVAYQTDIEKLEKVLEGVKDDILKIENVKDYKLLGLDEFAESSLVYVVDIKCKAMTILPTRRRAKIRRKVRRESSALMKVRELKQMSLVVM